MAGDAEQAVCNAVLEGFLARAQWTPENLGVRLNALAAKLGLRARMHPKSAVRWVRTSASHPVLCVPREPWPALVCLLLHQQVGERVTPEMLGWPVHRGLLYVPANDGLSQPWDAAGALAALGEVVDADSMERRHFVAVLASPGSAPSGCAGSPPPGSAPARSSRRVPPPEKRQPRSGDWTPPEYSSNLSSSAAPPTRTPAPSPSANSTPSTATCSTPQPFKRVDRE